MASDKGKGKQVESYDESFVEDAPSLDDNDRLRAKLILVQQLQSLASEGETWELEDGDASGNWLAVPDTESSMAPESADPAKGSDAAPERTTQLGESVVDELFKLHPSLRALDFKEIRKPRAGQSGRPDNQGGPSDPKEDVWYVLTPEQFQQVMDAVNAPKE